MGDKKGIFSTWLKQFILLVFIQSFQAIFMTFSLKVMAEIISGASEVKFENGKVGKNASLSNNPQYFICSLVAYISITALIKMEKLVKQLFGIEDSPLIGDMGKQMKNLMHGAKHMMDLAGRTTNSIKEVGAAKADAAKQQRITERKRKAGLIGPKGANGLPMSSNLEGGNLNSKALGDRIVGALQSGGVGGSGSSEGGSKSKIDWGDDSRFNDRGEMLSEEAYQERQEHESKVKVDLAKRKAALQMLSTIGSLGIANGASDTFEEAMTTADNMDKVTAGARDKIAGAQNKKYAGKLASEKIKQYTEAEEKAFEQIHEDLRKDIKSGGKSGAVTAAQAAKKEVKARTTEMRDMYADLAGDFDKSFSQRLGDQLKSKADAWKEAVDYTVSTSTGGPRVSSQERKVVKEVKEDIKKRTNNNNN